MALFLLQLAGIFDAMSPDQKKLLVEIRGLNARLERTKKEQNEAEKTLKGFGRRLDAIIVSLGGDPEAFEAIEIGDADEELPPRTLPKWKNRDEKAAKLTFYFNTVLPSSLKAVDLHRLVAKNGSEFIVLFSNAVVWGPPSAVPMMAQMAKRLAQVDEEFVHDLFMSTFGSAIRTACMRPFILRVARLRLLKNEVIIRTLKFTWACCDWKVFPLRDPEVADAFNSLVGIWLYEAVRDYPYFRNDFAVKWMQKLLKQLKSLDWDDDQEPYDDSEENFGSSDSYNSWKG
ncbi:hypothetical protein L596_015820 [Steinernema carpocapsae]|uniref:Uncharacterized protein n=1 Tax=Steinernema carpocapsae TaxID=34508 RepID=A0A4U5NH66_STECR|nr:hypothetical protein L596_015820 [Steinernema carpocapsae]